MAAAGLTAPTMNVASKRAPSLWRAWLTAYGAIWAFTLAAAFLVRVVPGGPALARQSLALKLTAAHKPPPHAGLVLSITLNNTPRAVWPLTLGVLGAQRHRLSRRLADAAVAANLLLSGLLVGTALGGYGIHVVPFLPHTPVEWAGLATGTTGWRIRRRRQLAKHELLALGWLTAALLGISALIETSLAPHR
jgi:hypothetical protein